MSRPLPTRLGKSPLIEAVFEIRFDSDIPVSNIFSGVFFTQLSCSKIERLPHADIPESIRQKDSNLKYSPVSRISWEGFWINVGDNSLGLATGFPYKGWDEFRRKIHILLTKANEFRLIKKLERFSLKYIDIFQEKEFQIGQSGLDISLDIGKKQYNNKATHVRTEINEGGSLHIIQIAGEAIGTLPNGETKHGVLLDIDSVKMDPPNTIKELLNEFEQNLDALHLKNKELFFSMLTKDGLDKLEPHYE